MAVSINYEIEKDYGSMYLSYDPNDLSTWKYYLNLTGEYHTFDTLTLGEDGIRITLLEDNLEYKLTKELLENNYRTKTELEKMSTYYTSLVEAYPKYEGLIKGIVFPVTMDIAINSKSGSILNYNKDLVENNEYSLIAALERSTDHYLKRWNVMDYALTDSLYVSSMLANITSLLILKTVNHRLSRTGTHEAHSFHMNEFFKSNLGIADDVEILSPDTKMWLYKNLKFLIKNIGKDSTLQLLIDNVHKKAGLSVTEVIVKPKEPILLNDYNDLTKSPYRKQEDNLFKVEHGKDNHNLKETDVDLLLALELNSTDYDIDYLIKNEEKYIFETKEDLKNVRNSTERTKIISLEAENSLDIKTVDFTEVIFEHWLKFIMDNDAYSDLNTKKFLDRSTGVSYSLSPLQGAYFVIKAILNKVSEENETFDRLTYNTILDKTIPEEELFLNLVIKDNIKVDILRLIDMIPTSDSVTTDLELQEYLLSINAWYLKYWTYMCNVNQSHATILEIVLDRLRTPIQTDPIDITTIDNALINSGVNLLGTNNFDGDTILNDVIKLFTGIDIDISKNIEKMISNYKNIIDALSSYSTQVINKKARPHLQTANHSIDILSELDVSLITDGYYNCIERLDATLSGVGNDKKESVIANYASPINFEIANVDPVISVSTLPINGLTELPVIITAVVDDSISEDSYMFELPYTLIR